MRTLKIQLQREITDEEADKLTNLIKVFAPIDLGTVSDKDLGAMVAGMVAGHIDKLIGKPRAGFAGNGWRFNE